MTAPTVLSDRVCLSCGEPEDTKETNPRGGDFGWFDHELEGLVCQACGAHPLKRARRRSGKLPAAVALGRLGGRSTSAKKVAASRTNGAKGGRPKTSTPAPIVRPG